MILEKYKFVKRFIYILMNIYFTNINNLNKKL
jgi:hypothetical protein